jgi:hypothetical protein
LRQNLLSTKVRLVGGLDCRTVCSPFSKEKTEMPGAALTAAERPQERGQKNSPAKNASMGPQDVFAAA